MIFSLQEGQILIQLIFGHLAAVLIPFYFFVLYKSIKNVVAKCLSHQLTLFRELNSLPEAIRQGVYPSFLSLFFPIFSFLIIGVRIGHR